MKSLHEEGAVVVPFTGRRSELAVPAAPVRHAGAQLAEGRPAVAGPGAPPAAVPTAGVEAQAWLVQCAGRYTQARSMLRTALAVEDSPRLRLALARTALWDTGWQFSDEALLTAVGSGEPALQALALAVHAITLLANGSAGSAQRSAHEAARVLERPGVPRSVSTLTCLGWAETHLERHAAARRHFTQCLEHGRALGGGPALVPALAGLATVHLREGAVRQAAEAADQALALARSPGTDDLLAMALTTSSEVALARGRVLSALAHGDQAANLVSPDSPWWRRARLSLAAARLADNTPAHSVALILDAAGGDSLRELPAWDHVGAGGQLARAEFLSGNLAEASSWSARATRAAAALGLPSLRAQASLTAAVVARGPGEALVHASAALGSANPLLRAEAHDLVADALTTLNERARAAEHRGAASSLVHRHGGGAARGTASARTAPPEGQYMLSPREHEIATLVSGGRTNRQIARELETSHKTVETHLARIFAKLEVSSRAEIANLVGRARVVARPKRGQRPASGQA